ncbi:hypothetical protein [Streptococcus pseudoporcinus]|uniref:hypothetical protein n=1 Tax=Streptococcus pseudoporcinus TaxID=361101 RepID=UPI00116F4477|nr:Uncharacterised protein [Streptococcus pseudoporcinus]
MNIKKITGFLSFGWIEPLKQEELKDNLKVGTVETPWKLDKFQIAWLSISDGQRLQVIHNLGDEFILDFDFQIEEVVNIDDLTTHVVGDIVPIFKVSGYCSKSGEDMYRFEMGYPSI